MINDLDMEAVQEQTQSSYRLPQQHIPSLYDYSNPILVCALSFFLADLFIYFEPFFTSILKWILVLFFTLTVCILLIYLFTDERRAIRRYIYIIQKEQEKQKRIYIVLSSSQFATANNFTASADPPQEVQEVLEGQNENLMLLGVPGAGKSISLQVHQHNALDEQHITGMMRGTHKIPIFIPLKDYNFFLNESDLASVQFEAGIFLDTIQQLPLLGYLAAGTLPGTKHIRHYVKKWMKKGRLLLLCDGLNEMNASFQPLVCEELLYIMRQSKNRIVMTCRELDYIDHQMFSQLVGDGLAHRRILRPLHSNLIKEFISKYIEEYTISGEVSRYTADQVFDLIKKTRLRYECTNPLMLATLIEVVNNSTQRTSSQIETRGKLLRAWIASLIEREMAKDAWQSLPFQSRDVVTLFSQVAYIARRRSKDSRNALPLGTGSTKKKYSIRELANELDRLLADPRGPDSTITLQDHVWKEPFAKSVLETMLEFALQADIITFSSGYLLSFRHELIAEYFVAEYLNIAYQKLNCQELPFGVALIQNISDWKEPIRNWAGLVDDQVILANHLARLGLQNSVYEFNALTLSLLCLGTRLGTVEDQARTQYRLPEYTRKLFIQHRDTPEHQERLAKTIDECAQEGGIGVYRAFLPLLHTRNIDKIILKLDRERVPEMLFEHMGEMIEKNAHMDTLPHVIAILGKFGNASLQLAIKYSQPNVSAHTRTAPQHLQLRQAAIKVLGLTGESAAVAPLLHLLNEITSISNSARDALIRLGPELVLPALLKRLATHIPSNNNGQVHFALLEIFEHFLTQGWNKQLLSTTHYQTIITALLPALFTPYMESVQELASTLLLQEAQTQTPRRDQVIEMLIEQLSAKDSTHIKDILSDNNTISAPLLLRSLRQSSSETHYERIVEVLGLKHDPDALPALIDLIVTPLPNLRKKVAKTLIVLQPESIQALIAVVLQEGYEEAIAAHKILQEIGRSCTIEVCNALNPIVPGRTQLLVEILAHIHDTYAIPYLALLLGNALHDDGLAITAIHALREFSDQRVVAALLATLNCTNNAVYDEAAKALSQLGMISFASMVDALNAEQETHATSGIRDALTHIKSDAYPYEQLLTVVEQASKAQEQQIMKVFLARGADAAPFLVEHLCFQHERARKFIHQTIDAMHPDDCLLTLLHAVDNVNCRNEVSSRLLKYHQITVPHLVQQLEDIQYGTGSAEILADFGPKVIPYLLPGLDSGIEQARKLARQVMARVARQHHEILPEIILLFKRTSNSPDASRAYTSLVSVLTNSLADLSISHLLEGLASDQYLVRAGVKDTLVQLARLGNERSKQVLDGLTKALEIAERRNEAIQVLIQIGKPVIASVNELITHPNPAVKEAAILIMSKLPPEGALLTLFEDMKDVTRREAAHTAYRMMDTSGIQKPLIDLLSSDDLPKVLSATTLLLQRLIDDIDRPDTDKQMLPALLDSLQQHGRGNDTMHIVIFLLLLPKDLLLILARNMLFRNPVSQEWLTPFILLLDIRDTAVKRLLIERLGDANMSPGLRAQIIGLLGMIDESRNSPVLARAMSINQLTERGRGRVSQEELMVAQHALGGLLMSSRWNRDTLQQLRQPLEPETYQHELYSILLGESYIPRIMSLRSELGRERVQIEAQKLIITNLQRDISIKEQELDKAQKENQSARNLLAASQNSVRSLQAENTQLRGENSTHELQIQAQLQRIHELEHLLLRSLHSTQSPGTI